jgi:threonine/homoserine/homoserine lactone efflux protein
MKKLLLILSIFLIPAFMLPGCSIITGEDSTISGGRNIPVNTEFGRMLGYIPYTLLQT